jgi:hypothetical protein
VQLNGLNATLFGGNRHISPHEDKQTSCLTAFRSTGSFQAQDNNLHVSVAYLLFDTKESFQVGLVHIPKKHDKNNFIRKVSVSTICRI